MKYMRGVLLLATVIAIRQEARCETASLATSVHQVRWAVEFHMDGKFDAVGMIELHIPSYILLPLGGSQAGKNQLVYIYFSPMYNKAVIPFVHIMDIEQFKVTEDGRVVFSGTSDYGFSFEGYINNYSDVLKREITFTIRGAARLVAKSIVSDEAKAFKEKFLNKVDLGQ